MGENLELFYSGEYPDMPEFLVPWEVKTIQVGQGSAGRSVNGEALESEGFTKCSALILKNSSTNETALFHIDDIDLGDRQMGVFRTVVDNFIQSGPVEGSQKDKLRIAAGEVSKYFNPRNMKRVELTEELRKLNSNNTLTAAYIVSDDGRNILNRVKGSLLNFLAIPVVFEKEIKSGRRHWGIVYKPYEGKIFLDIRSEKKLLTFDF